MMKRSTQQVETRYPQCNLSDCLLPWTQNFDLDVPAYVAHIQAVLDGGYKHLYLAGTAGEGYALSEKRFEQAVEIFADKTVKPDIDPQVGIISTSMEHMMDRMAFCYEKGIRMFQITLPCWGALDDAELLLFFKTVCGNFSDCRFLHYNNIRCKRRLKGSDYRRIADEVPNLVASKTSSSDYSVTSEVIRNAPDLQHFFLENAWPYACLYGEASLLCSYDLIFPDLTRKFFDAGRQGSVKEAFAIQERLMAVEEGLFASVTSDYIDGAWDKTFAWLKYPDFPMRLLPPYEGLTANEAKSARDYYEHQCGDLS